MPQLIPQMGLQNIQDAVVSIADQQVQQRRLAQERVMKEQANQIATMEMKIKMKKAMDENEKEEWNRRIQLKAELDKIRDIPDQAAKGAALKMLASALYGGDENKMFEDMGMVGKSYESALSMLVKPEGTASEEEGRYAQAQKAKAEALRANAEIPKTQAETDFIREGVYKTQAETGKLGAETDKTKAEIDKIKSDINMARFEAAKMREDAYKAKAEALKLREETRQMSIPMEDRLKALSGDSLPIDTKVSMPLGGGASASMNLNPAVSVAESEAITKGETASEKLPAIIKALNKNALGKTSLERTTNQLLVQTPSALSTAFNPKLQDFQSNYNALRQIALFGDAGKALTGTEKEEMLRLLTLTGKSNATIKNDLTTAANLLRKKEQLLLKGAGAAGKTPGMSLSDEYKAWKARQSQGGN